MNKLTCPICKFRISHTLRSVNVPDYEYGLQFRANYSECPQCKAFWQTPMPDDITLSSFYPESYHSFSLTSWLMRVRIWMRVKRLSKFISPEGNILDYGCGNGAFLIAASKAFPDNMFYGYEISSANEVVSINNGRVTIIKGDENYFWSQAPLFKVVILNHVIEHLRDPLLILSAIWKHLENGGFVEGQTPNSDSYDRQVFNQFWSGFHAPRHTVIFSKKSLRLALVKLDFTRVSISPAFNPAGIAMSLCALRNGNNSGLTDRRGVFFLLAMCAATILAIFDLISMRPGIINFSAVKE